MAMKNRYYMTSDPQGRCIIIGARTPEMAGEWIARNSIVMGPLTLHGGSFKAESVAGREANKRFTSVQYVRLLLPKEA